VVGSTQVRFHEGDQKDVQVLLTKAKAIEPSLANYNMPPTDSEAIVGSLLYQAGRHREVNPPRDLPEYMEKVIHMYPKSNPPPGFTKSGVDEIKLMRVIRSRVAFEVKRHSSPGVPLAHLASANGPLIDKYYEQIVLAVYARLKLLMETDEARLHKLSPVELVQQGFCDPIKLFVKGEGHDRDKLLTGRVRLISSVALVDQVVERVLSTTQNLAEKRNWFTTPTKCGIGFTHAENLRMYEAVNEKGPRAQSDISGFDWSVQYWELVADANMRIVLNGCDPNGMFARALRNRVRCLASSVFSLPDGRLVAQSLPALQKSGSFNTSPTNSRIRVMLAVATGASWAIAHGDDCVEQFIPGAQKRYGELGRICKFYDKCEPDQFVFCSRQYTPKGAYPVNWVKGLFNLLISKENHVALIEDYCREYHSSEMFLWCLHVITASGWGGREVLEKLHDVV
jgi:hypothetical protein